MELKAEHIGKSFVTSKGEQIEAIGDITFSIRDEEFVCIVGPSGCGKTTLLRIIAGLDTPSTGKAELGGKEIVGPSPKMAMIFQEYSLYPWRTVLDNVAFGLEVQGMEKERRYEAAKRYIKLVGLEEFETSYPYELSGGMRQRVAVARALAVEPDVLLMDEPFGALDAQTRNAMQTELLEIWEKTRKTVLFVTHSVDEAVFLADHIFVLSARPSTIREIVDVPLSRPRDRTSVEFAHVRRYVLSLIQNTGESSQ